MQKKISLLPNSIKNYFNQIINPVYGEIDLFLMSTVSILIFISHDDMRRVFWDKSDLDGMFAFIVSLFGVLFSIANGFSNRKKGEVQKFFILFAVVYISLIVAIETLAYAMDQKVVSGLPFAILNLFYAFIVFLRFRADKITTKNISDKEVELGRISFSLIIAISVFCYFEYVSKAHWTITYSFCIFYAFFCDHFINRLYKLVKDIINISGKIPPGVGSKLL